MDRHTRKILRTACLIQGPRHPLKAVPLNLEEYGAIVQPLEYYTSATQSALRDVRNREQSLCTRLKSTAGLHHARAILCTLSVYVFQGTKQIAGVEVTMYFYYLTWADAWRRSANVGDLSSYIRTVAEIGVYDDMTRGFSIVHSDPGEELSLDYPRGSSVHKSIFQRLSHFVSRCRLSKSAVQAHPDKSAFLLLPREIRDVIYAAYLQGCTLLCVGSNWDFWGSREPLPQPALIPPGTTPLLTPLLVNKQVHEEYRHELQRMLRHMEERLFLMTPWSCISSGKRWSGGRTSHEVVVWFKPDCPLPPLREFERRLSTAVNVFEGTVDTLHLYCLFLCTMLYGDQEYQDLRQYSGAKVRTSNCSVQVSFFAMQDLMLEKPKKRSFANAVRLRQSRSDYAPSPYVAVIELSPGGQEVIAFTKPTDEEVVAAMIKAHGHGQSLVKSLLRQDWTLNPLQAAEHEVVDRVFSSRSTMMGVRQLRVDTGDPAR